MNKVKNKDSDGYKIISKKRRAYTICYINRYAELFLLSYYGR